MTIQLQNVQIFKMGPFFNTTKQQLNVDQSEMHSSSWGCSVMNAWSVWKNVGMTVTCSLFAWQWCVVKCMSLSCQHSSKCNGMIVCACGDDNVYSERMVSWCIWLVLFIGDHVKFLLALTQLKLVGMLFLLLLRCLWSIISLLHLSCLRQRELLWPDSRT